MNIQELIKQLNDMKLLYGNKIILTITDGESDYIIKDITGMQCAKYFVQSDRVAEVIINIKRKEELFSTEYLCQWDELQEAIETLGQTDLEQHETDLQDAYDCGYNCGYADAMNNWSEDE